MQSQLKLLLEAGGQIQIVRQYKYLKTVIGQVNYKRALTGQRQETWKRGQDQKLRNKDKERLGMALAAKHRNAIRDTSYQQAYLID